MVIASIKDPVEIEKIFTHLDKKDDSAAAPGLRPSQAPPRMGLFDCGAGNHAANTLGCGINGGGRVAVGLTPGRSQKIAPVCGRSLAWELGFRPTPRRRAGWRLPDGLGKLERLRKELLSCLYSHLGSLLWRWHRRTWPEWSHHAQPSCDGAAAHAHRMRRDRQRRFRGALAISVGGRVLMLEYSSYSAISPEGCAAILWHGTEREADAAQAMSITSRWLA